MVKTRILKRQYRDSFTNRAKMGDLYDSKGDKVKRTGEPYCGRHRSGFTECTCQLCLMWHKYFACYFGMMDPMAREIIETCTCPENTNG
jgi:hypothetical protein